MVYLRQMSRVKRGCPKFRLRWRGPYEVILRLSDFNYLVQVLPRKELVVNVNKIKRCCVKISPSQSRIRDISVRDQEGDKSQDVASDDGTTPPVSYEHIENEDSSVFTPPSLTDEGTEDRSQDPTWEPSRRQEFQRPTDESPNTGRETVARYWLRSRQGENTVESGETPTGMQGEGTTDTEAVEVEPPESAVPEAGNVLEQAGGTTDTDAVEVEPPESALPEAGNVLEQEEGTTDTDAVEAEPPESALPEAGNVLEQEEGTEQPPRYNFQPLPGRKF
jgi:hypothetical protein